MIWLIYTFIFLVGTIIGSFLNVVICRLPKKESIVVVGSHCPKCNNKICWFDLIPIISYFLLRGKCRNCKENISWQYPLVEFATGALFLGFALLHGYDNPLFFRDAFFSLFLILILALDAKHFLVFDEIVIPGIIIGVVSNLLIGWVNGNFLSTAFSLGIAIIVAVLFFAFQYFVSNGKWIGSGDIFIGAMIAAMLGWPLVAFAIFSGYIVGALIAVVLLALKIKQRQDHLPLGVFLCMGALFAMFCGNDLINWYLDKINL
jgi:leader peptidase (prepilin peptidase)/N-methyltransferase